MPLLDRVYTSFDRVGECDVESFQIVNGIKQRDVNLDPRGRSITESARLINVEQG
jgi:hypothetical protein